MIKTVHSLSSHGLKKNWGYLCWDWEHHVLVAHFQCRRALFLGSWCCPKFLQKCLYKFFISISFKLINSQRLWWVECVKKEGLIFQGPFQKEKVWHIPICSVHGDTLHYSRYPIASQSLLLMLHFLHPVISEKGWWPFWHILGCGTEKFQEISQPMANVLFFFP